MGYASAFGATATLAALWAWLGWWDYSRLGLIGAGLGSIPLLLMLPALWKRRLRAHQLGTMIATLYMALAAMEIFASGGNSGASGLFLASTLWFGCSLLYCRAELRRGQQLRQ